VFEQSLPPNEFAITWKSNRPYFAREDGTILFPDEAFA
jgi:hypothetical protein